ELELTAPVPAPQQRDGSGPAVTGADPPHSCGAARGTGEAIVRPLRPGTPEHDRPLRSGTPEHVVDKTAQAPESLSGWGIPHTPRRAWGTALPGGVPRRFRSCYTSDHAEFDPRPIRNRRSSPRPGPDRMRGAAGAVTVGGQRRGRRRGGLRARGGRNRLRGPGDGHRRWGVWIRRRIDDRRRGIRRLGGRRGRG